MAKSVADEPRLRARQQFGDRLKLARELLGLSQRRLAEFLGIAPLSVIQYEAGRSAFPVDRLPVLEELGFDAAWVATGLPSLKEPAARSRFASVLAWVGREAAIYELSISPSQQLDIAWYVFSRFAPRPEPGAAMAEADVVREIRSQFELMER